MSAKPPLKALPFGLLELDAASVVVGYSSIGDYYSDIQVQEVLGRNFFTEILPATQFVGLEKRFRDFMGHGESVERFAFTFPSEQGDIELQIALAYLPKQSGKENVRLAIARLMLLPEKASSDHFVM
jgi:photoactive yellow protein